jgi:exopolysaccharide production protein ExoQ
MAAMFALIVFIVQFAARSGSRVWSGVWIVVAVGTLALTRSSTVMAATLAALVVGVFILIVRSLRGRRRIVAYVVGGAIAVAGVAVVLLGRAEILKLLNKSSDLTYRGVIWSTVTKLAEQRPVGGWGWISYWTPWTEPYAGLIEHGGVNYLQAHDAWLDVFLQLGIVGLVVFGVFVLVALVRAWLAAVDATPRVGLLRVAPLLLLVALLVHSIAESRLLIEIGFALLVFIAITVTRKPAAP